MHSPRATRGTPQPLPGRRTPSVFRCGLVQQPVDRAGVAVLLGGPDRAGEGLVALVPARPSLDERGRHLLRAGLLDREDLAEQLLDRFVMALPADAHLAVFVDEQPAIEEEVELHEPQRRVRLRPDRPDRAKAREDAAGADPADLLGREVPEVTEAMGRVLRDELGLEFLYGRAIILKLVLQGAPLAVGLKPQAVADLTPDDLM